MRDQWDPKAVHFGPNLTAAMGRAPMYVSFCGIELGNGPLYAEADAYYHKLNYTYYDHAACKMCLRHMCRHCKRWDTEHADGKKCLFMETSFSPLG